MLASRFAVIFIFKFMDVEPFSTAQEPRFFYLLLNISDHCYFVTVFLLCLFLNGFQI